ncbi:MAG TPA: DUF559 domain-containing protein [Nitrospirae bacterium]|nr:DUF559 domain-containing protein [Nitrospirota bacterium]
MTRVFNKSKETFKRKQLRNKLPHAEVVLWSKLKGKQIGCKFRRQYSVEKFVIDFVCSELKLAIEVDGDSHYTEGAKCRDSARERILESYGTAFLRFTNREIYENLNGVLIKIQQFIKRLKK